MGGEYMILNMQTSDIVERIKYADDADGCAVYQNAQDQAACMNKERGAVIYMVLQVEDI